LIKFESQFQFNLQLYQYTVLTTTQVNSVHTVKRKRVKIIVYILIIKQGRDNKDTELKLK